MDWIISLKISLKKKPRMREKWRKLMAGDKCGAVTTQIHLCGSVHHIEEIYKKI